MPWYFSWFPYDFRWMGNGGWLGLKRFIFVKNVELESSSADLMFGFGGLDRYQCFLWFSKGLHGVPCAARSWMLFVCVWLSWILIVFDWSWNVFINVHGFALLFLKMNWHHWITSFIDVGLCLKHYIGFHACPLICIDSDGCSFFLLVSNNLTNCFSNGVIYFYTCPLIFMGFRWCLWRCIIFHKIS